MSCQRRGRPFGGSSPRRSNGPSTNSTRRSRSPSLPWRDRAAPDPNAWCSPAASTASASPSPPSHAPRPGGFGIQSAPGATTCLQARCVEKAGTRRHRVFAGTFHEDRDAVRTLDLLRIRQYLNRRDRNSENGRFAGTSKRLKGLEPSTFCMASRPTSNLLVDLLPANNAKRELCTGRGLSQISPGFAWVLSTNCPPRCRADRAPRSPGACRVAGSSSAASRESSDELCCLCWS
jgi:hypothetical protein